MLKLKEKLLIGNILDRLSEEEKGKLQKHSFTTIKMLK